MRDGIGVRRIRTFPFLPTPSLTFRLGSSETKLSESEAEAEGLTNENARSHAL